MMAAVAVKAAAMGEGWDKEEQEAEEDADDCHVTSPSEGKTPR